MINLLATIVIVSGGVLFGSQTASAQYEIIEAPDYCCKMYNCNCCGASHATCNPQVGCYCK